MPKRAEIVGLYPETGWDYDKIEAILRSHTSIKEYILALHDQDVDGDGNPMKPHHHVYLNFGNTNWKYEDIAKWFGIPSNMVGKIEADPQDKHPIIGQYAVIRYYTCQRQPENVDFRRNGMSFFGGQHSGVYSPYTPLHLPA